MGEKHIWQAIAKNPASIGFPRALALPQVQLGRAAGYIDLVLIPPPARQGPKLVLVEAKASKNSESSDKVIGQLLKYYARALHIGAEGLEGLRRCAQKVADGNGPNPPFSVARLFGVEQRSARVMLSQGRQLEPADVALVVALDEYRDRHERRLGFIIATLRKHHSLPIDLYKVEDGRATRCHCTDERLPDAV